MAAAGMLLVPMAVSLAPTPATAAPAAATSRTAAQFAGEPQIILPAEPTTIGELATFTIIKAAGTAPIGFQYQLNDGPPEDVLADADGNATIEIMPTRFTNVLSVTSLLPGNLFGETTDVFFNSVQPPPDIDGDLTGDGTPDLLVVGATHGLPSGLWLASGADTGATVAATNIGIRGNGTAGSNDPADFDGAHAVTGRFTGGPFQDVLAYYPGGVNPGGAGILRAYGNGDILRSNLNDNHFGIDPLLLHDEHGNSPRQLVSAGDPRGTGSPFPDLIGISGDPVNGYHLTHYLNFGWSGGYTVTNTLVSSTPTGGSDWENWTIATTQLPTGTAMFLWQRASGALHLWTGVTIDAETGQLNYTAHSLATNWNTGADLTLRAADIDNDGAPDLWTVGANATVTAWHSGSLGGGTGTIIAKPSQTLVPSM